MRRRNFIKMIAASAAAWPLAARAQAPTDRMRQLGVLMGYSESDPEAHKRLAAFTQRFGSLGWIEGRNLKIITR
jgi:putative tryptophan/tyrosine transport system substrate-binding protein